MLVFGIWYIFFTEQFKIAMFARLRHQRSDRLRRWAWWDVSTYSLMDMQRSIRLSADRSIAFTGLCMGNSPLTGEFPAQMASNAKNVSIWWSHHAIYLTHTKAIWRPQKPRFRDLIIRPSYVILKRPLSSLGQAMTVWPSDTNGQISQIWDPVLPILANVVNNCVVNIGRIFNRFGECMMECILKIQ